MHIGGMRSTFALLAIHVAPMHSLLGIGGLARRVRRLPVATARVERVQTFWCRDDDDSPLAGRLEAMLEMSPSLQRPRYRPSVRSSKANFMVATLRSRLGALRRSMEPPLLNRTSECGDPDLTVEWVKDEVGASLPPNAPIVIFLHTITGTAAQTRWLMAYASTRGWRSCVFVRRGHSHRRLSSPTFNLMGAVEDVNVQLATVQAAYPDAAFLGMVGISAGSAQLISYLGRAGHASPVGAACAICPAWNVSAAFSQIGVTQPLAESAMLSNIKKRFIYRNERLLRSWDSSAVDACLEARSLVELLEAHAPFAMRERGATGAAYLAAHDPMEDRRGIAVPVLLLNAQDDFVCPAELARPEIVVNEQPGALLLITRSGSHVAFNEGRFARGSFHSRVSFDFLDAALATANSLPETGEAAAEPPAVVQSAVELRRGGTRGAGAESERGVRGVVVPTARPGARRHGRAAKVSRSSISARSR